MIRLELASFSFGGKPILSEAMALVPEGARIGLLGRNGAGKTTLFRLILGELPLDSGDIVRPRQWNVAFLPQHPAFPPEETVLQHLLESQPILRDLEDEILRLEQKMSGEEDPAKLDRLVERHRALSRDFEMKGGYDIEARVAAALVGLGFSRESLLQQLGTLSPGEKNRIALAKVLLSGADVLLLDEPTNHLDFEMLEWLEGFLQSPPRSESQRKVTVVVTSHDRYFLNQFADHVYELRGGKIYPYRGDYDDFARQRAEELKRQEKEYRLQQEEIARELEFIRRNFAAQKARQAKSREKSLDRMEIVEAPKREPEGPRMRFRGILKAGDDVLRVDELDCGYGDKVLLRGVCLELRRGERVAILGPNGCGKTTLLKCLVGQMAPLGGSIHRGQKTVMGYHEQEISKLGSEKSIFEEIHDLVPAWTNQEVRDLLAAFLFRGDEVSTETRVLSGGEQARVALIRLILSGANLLVLDEPTNHLDVYARAALEESLLDFPETILFVSHDRYFIDRLATRVLGVVGEDLREFMGGYAEYRDVLRRREMPPENQGSRARKEKSGSGRSPGGEGKKNAREEARLVLEISRTEEDIRRKQEECGFETHYRNPDLMRRLKREICELEAQLQLLYRKWEEIVDGGPPRVAP